MANKFNKEKNIDLNKDNKTTTGVFETIKNAFDTNTTQEEFSKFAHTAEDAMHSAKESVQSSCSVSKNLFENLTQNINNSFKHNLTLGQSCLQCKTATDFADMQRKFFECNYKNMMKTYSDLMHDIQQMTSQTMQKSTSFMPKGN